MKRLIIISLFIIACQKTDEKKPFVINGAGSTFVYPLISKWSYNFYNETKNQVNYQSIGSGGGIKQVIERVIDFGASDKPLEKEKLDSSQLFQFPIIVGGISIVYNIPNLNERLYLSGDVICDIYLGKIEKWNDERIKKLNPKINLPNLKITPVRR